MLGKKHSKKTRQLIKKALEGGTHSRYPWWSCKPESEKIYTGYWRAKKILKAEKCALFNKKDCRGPIHIHHIDKNPLNNNLNNLMTVCATHHRFLDLGRITLDNPEIPPFYVDAGGKRRYKKVSCGHQF
jgi:hypothetical protein